MTVNRLLPILLLAALIPVLAMGQPARGQNLAEIFDVDETYTKDLPAGETVSFTWLTYNRDTTDVLFQTQVEPTSDADWSAGVAPAFRILAPGESTEVNLTVSSLFDAQEQSVSFTVTLSLVRAGDPAVNETWVRSATVNLVPAPPPLPTGNLILGIFENPLPPPFNSRAVTFVINIALWGVIAGIAVLVLTPILRRLFRKTKTELDDVVLHIVRGPLILLLLTYGAVQSVAVLQPPIEVTNTLFLAYTVVLIATLTWVAYRLFHGVLIEFGRRAARTRQATVFGRILPLLNVMGAITIFVGGAAALLAAFGYDLTAFLVGAGVLGIAIAFAAQESLSNFFSGIFLMLDQPFKEGDLVEIDGDRARVEKIGIRSTILYHRPSHKLLVVPNNKMAGDVVVNLAKPDLAIRQSTTVGVAYGSDLETVKTILAESASDHPGVHKSQPGRQPYARLEEFGDYALIFKLKFWVKDADLLNRVRGEVNETIVQRLTEAGIEIPPPMMTVELEEGEGKPPAEER